jgi:hypothetical protein
MGIPGRTPKPRGSPYILRQRQRSGPGTRQTDKCQA